MAATKPGSSPSMRGAAERASASRSAPPIRVRVRKSASVATGAKRLHSIEKPSRAMRGRRAHSAIPSSSAIRGVAFRPVPVITSTVVCSGVIVPVASSLANAAAAWAQVGST